MKKAISAAAVSVLLLTSVGCTAALPDGYQTVRDAKEKYETLDVLVKRTSPHHCICNSAK